MSICSECPHRQYCFVLCPEAELFVKQDEVPQRELTIGIPRYGGFAMDLRKREKLTKRERLLLNLLIEGNSFGESAQAMNITNNTVKVMVHNIRNKI